jgi:hypothetical protein
MKGFFEYLGVYATYSELFGKAYDKEQLKKDINGLPLGGMLVILSQFNSIPIDDPIIRSKFEQFLKNHFPTIKPLDTKLVLYTKQGLLALWKWLLSYGDEEKIEQEAFIDAGINALLYTNLVISDFLYVEDEKDKTKYDLFTNSLFNTNNDVVSSFVRASVMFDEIAKQEGNFEKKEYIDINASFNTKYGYSIKEYLGVIFSLITPYMKRNSVISPEWNRTNEFFSELKNPEIAYKIIDELSMSHSEAKEWSKTTLEQPWNFTKFRQKPILKFDDGKFCPINLTLLYEQVFSELYFKIRHAYSGESTQISFFGRIFEKYIEVIAHSATSISRFDYEFIPEFKYGAKKSKKSPDVLIRLGDKLLAVEAKVYRVKMDSFIGTNHDTIDSDIHRMAIAPKIQLHTRLKELKDINHPVMEGINEIYLMSVTLGDLPSLPPFEREIDSKLREKFELPIKGHYHLDVEEFEQMCELLARKNASPIFKYLNNFSKMQTSFRNYMFQSKLHPRRLKYIEDKFGKHINEMVKILFDH